MLDDPNIISQRDPSDALKVAAEQWQQATFAATVKNPDNDARPIDNIIVAGMGGSALAALIANAWLTETLPVPFEVVREYQLPHYVSENSLVIASSYSGNTEETLACYDQARQCNAQVAVISAGGALIEKAQNDTVGHVVLPSGMQPRMGTIASLRAIVQLLVHFGVVEKNVFESIAKEADGLKAQTSYWLKNQPIDKNFAKQLAIMTSGKTPVFYGGQLTAPIAYKWKISWNENAKNVAFWNQYPEFNHNEFVGWASHPIEKPFAILDLQSSYEHPRITERFKLSDKLLSGKRPAATTVDLRGETLIGQLLWACVLADFASIYSAILNNVDPTPVVLVEKLKQELTN